MNNIVKSAIEEKKQEVHRKEAIETITWNLGKVVETDKGIICYINLKNVKQDKNNISIYIPKMTEQHKRLIWTYKLNKPIRYVLDGYKIGRNIFIGNYDNAVLEIKNCNFLGTRFGLRSQGKCSISNSNIVSNYMLTLIGDDLTISNLNVFSLFYNNNVIIAGNNKLNINGLAFYGNYKGFTKTYVDHLNLYSQGTIQLNKTDLTAEEVEIDAQKVIADSDTAIKSFDSIVIKNNTEIDNLKLNCYKLLYNGLPINNDENKKIDITLTPLLLKRLELAETLKKVAEKIDKTNQTLVDSYKNNLEEHQVVGDTLKRIR